MTESKGLPLLAAHESPAFDVERPSGTADIVLVCDHASPRIPEALGTLGVSPADLATHVAWDIGAAGVARLLSEMLDATLVLQNYSRLVIDCNRPPGVAASIPVESEYVRIPGNGDLAPEQAASRRREIFDPYHDAIRRVLDERMREGRRPVLVAVHSFTPIFRGVARAWHCGLLYRHPQLARQLLQRLRDEPGLNVGDNEPYAVTDQTDYTLPVHGETRGIPHTGIEIRQDLIEREAGQREWAERLAKGLSRVQPPPVPDLNN